MGTITEHASSIAHEPGEARGSASDAQRPSARQALSLDGAWRFRTDESPEWRTAEVPGCWESQFPDLRGWAGTATYERTFRVPESFQGMRVFAHFGAVDFYAEVLVNGTLIGTHEGGYLPFEFDVTDVIRREGENTLTVRVTDSTPEVDAFLPDGRILHFADIPHGKQSWYSPVSGIWQSVRLESRPYTAIERLAIRADADSGEAAVTAAISRSPLSLLDPPMTLRLELIGPDGAGPGEPVRIPVEGGDISAALTVTQPLRWSPEAPFLYWVRATLENAEGEIDTIEERFGFRKIEAREGLVWLNGSPYFLIGALDQAFYPRTIYTPPSTDYLRDQFLKAKEMGLNLVRCHIKVPTPEYLDLCDELGLLVWCEIPNGSRLSDELRRHLRATFEGMLERDGNHPCLVILTLMNESWGIDLSDEEQRTWLRDTYSWAKERAPGRLIVDNSACIPNFHVVSDLDDYHVYYSFPDQARDFSDWVRSFADRDAGSYSGFGDAARMHTEPLLVSEFGNWGIPRLGPLWEAEGGEPWWFAAGEGITKPQGVLKRFEQQRLERAFSDFDALADSSQEQQWLAQKFQIEEMRLHRQVAGYVITELTDTHWEVNGLLDFARNPKVFYNRLSSLQQQDILIPRPERCACWEGEEIRVDVSLSKFSGAKTAGELLWRLGEQEGRIPAPEAPRGETTHLASLTIAAPAVPEPVKLRLELQLFAADGAVIARTEQNLVIAPHTHRKLGGGMRIWVHDPLGVAEELRARLSSGGFEVADAGDSGAIAVLTRWDNQALEHMKAGGRAVLLATHPKSLVAATGLNLRLIDRTLNNWWGDWCSTQTWFVKDAFHLLPDTTKFDFEFSHVIPRYVLSGAAPENVLCGLFVGWLRNPGAYVVRMRVGAGLMLATTFELAASYGEDPVATLLFSSLIEALDRP